MECLAPTVRSDYDDLSIRLDDGIGDSVEDTEVVEAKGYFTFISEARIQSTVGIVAGHRYARVIIVHKVPVAARHQYFAVSQNDHVMRVIIPVKIGRHFAMVAETRVNRAVGHVSHDRKVHLSADNSRPDSDNLTVRLNGH